MISLRLAVPTALALVGLAGCLTYFLIAPAPVAQSAALAAPPAAEAPSTVGQARATDSRSTGREARARRPRARTRASPRGKRRRGLFPCPQTASPARGKEKRGSRRSPSDERGTPGEASAEGRDEDEVTALQAAIARVFVERDRNRGRARVAITPDVVHAAFGRNLQPLGRRGENPLVRLVREEPAHVLGGEAALREDFLADLDHRADRDPERLAALHLD